MTNNKQQTGVDFFYDELIETTPFSISGIYTLYKKAKKMQKQRMIEFAQSYAVIHCMGDITKDAEQYYNETYGGNK
jgi:hypothetical protein